MCVHELLSSLRFFFFALLWMVDWADITRASVNYTPKLIHRLMKSIIRSISKSLIQFFRDFFQTKMNRKDFGCHRCHSCEITFPAHFRIQWHTTKTSWQLIFDRGPRQQTEIFGEKSTIESMTTTQTVFLWLHFQMFDMTMNLKIDFIENLQKKLNYLLPTPIYCGYLLAKFIKYSYFVNVA